MVHLEWDLHWFGIIFGLASIAIPVFFGGKYLITIIKENRELREENHGLLRENTRLTEQLERADKTKRNEHS